MLSDMQRRDAALKKVLQNTLEDKRPAYRFDAEKHLLGIVVQGKEMYMTHLAALKDAFLVSDVNIAFAPLVQGGFEIVLSRVTWPWER